MHAVRKALKLGTEADRLFGPLLVFQGDGAAAAACTKLPLL